LRRFRFSLSHHTQETLKIIISFFSFFLSCHKHPLRVVVVTFLFFHTFFFFLSFFSFFLFEWEKELTGKNV